MRTPWSSVEVDNRDSKESWLSVGKEIVEISLANAVELLKGFYSNSYDGDVEVIVKVRRGRTIIKTDTF